MLSVISMKHSHKKVLPIRAIKAKYALFILVVSCIIGCVPFLGYEIGLPLEWIKLLQMLVFFTAGFIYASKFTLYNASKNDEINYLNFTLKLCVLICLALSILYYILQPDILLIAFGSACAFLLPNIIKSSWLALKDFSELEYGVWTKPVPETQEKTFIFFGGLALKINFSPNANDRHKKIFRSHAPLDKSIGDFFNHFLLIQRNNNKLRVELLDEDRQLFGWKFYHVTFWGLQKRQLNPEANLEEMNVKNHAIIMVERVRLANYKEDENNN